MEPLALQRERVQDDLRGLIGGDVRCDNIYLQLYASDGSIYEVRPSVVVQPRSAADVAACVQYAAEQGIPVHGRGAGTGTAGGALGPGLALDFSKYLRRVIRVDEAARAITTAGISPAFDSGYHDILSETVSTRRNAWRRCGSRTGILRSPS